MKHLFLACAAGALALAGCSAEDGASEPAGTASDSSTLATVIGQADGISTVASTLSDSGLSGVFDGAASYTVLAPNDAAFEAAVPEGTSLTGADGRPLAVAVVRQHIVPGYLSPDDIRKAIENADGGSVTMASYGGEDLTFTMDGETIMVAGPGGKSARLDGSASTASNGVVIPIDGVLVDIPAATTAAE